MTIQDNVSVYQGIAPKVAGKIPWTDAIKSIKSDKFKQQILSLRQIKDPDKYRKEKTNLFAVTFGGTFNGSRAANMVVETTGFLIPDIDHIENVQEKFDEIIQDEHIWFAFKSPGGDGIKCALRSDCVTNDVDHKLFFAAAQGYFKDVYGITIDKACKDISRLTFVSWDPGAYINENATYFDYSEFELPTEPPRSPPVELPDAEKAKAGDRFLAAAGRKIAESEPGNQHYTRISQARTVGGYVATGYIDHGQAVEALHESVVASGAEDMKASMKDIHDGLAYGKQAPLHPSRDLNTPPMPTEVPPEIDKKPYYDYETFERGVAVGVAAGVGALGEKKIPPKKEPLGVITFSEIAAREFEVSPIVDGIINEGDQTIIYSPGGVGKSLIAQDIAMHVACSPLKPLWGKFDIPKTRATAFIQSENSGLAIKERVRLKCDGLPELWSGADNLLVPHRGDNYQITGHVSDAHFRKEILEWLKRAQESIGDIPLDLIVWDPLISYHDGDENDNSTMRTTLDYITEISGEVSATSIVIHHSRKDADQNGEGMRGASSIFDWTRNGIKLEKDERKDQRQIIVKNVKSNNSKPFEPFRLILDDNLNFAEAYLSDLLPPNRRVTAQKIVEALSLLGGEATKRKLVDQYKELASIKSDRTAQNHADNAVTDGFISREYIRVGDSKVQVANYKLIGWESRGFDSWQP